MQAGHRGVLVHQRRRLQHPVGVGVLGDRIGHPHTEEARRGDRVRGEDHQPDGARDEHGVAQREIVHSTGAVQPDQGDGDHRPVTPDVHPVGQRDQPLAAQDQSLRPRFDVDPQASLERQHIVTVGHGDRRIGLCEPSDPEVEQHSAEDQTQLPKELVRCVERRTHRCALAVARWDWRHRLTTCRFVNEGHQRPPLFPRHQSYSDAPEPDSEKAVTCTTRRPATATHCAGTIGYRRRSWRIRSCRASRTRCRQSSRAPRTDRGRCGPRHETEPSRTQHARTQQSRTQHGHEHSIRGPGVTNTTVTNNTHEHISHEHDGWS